MKLNRPRVWFLFISIFMFLLLIGGIRRSTR